MKIHALSISEVGVTITQTRGSTLNAPKCPMIAKCYVSDKRRQKAFSYLLHEIFDCVHWLSIS